MRSIGWGVCLVLVSLPALAADAVCPKDAFVPLFDGKTFAGWEGNLKVFRIEDGAVVGGDMKKGQPHNEFLCTTKEYRDFELRLKFKVAGKGVNAGVQVRTKRIPNNHEVIGYQADIGEGYWGCLYDESRRGRLTGLPAAEAAKVVRLNDWNDYRILCQGDRIQLWVNGQPTADYTEKDAAIPRSGIIALQIHGGPPSEVRYKDVVIREVSP